MTFLATYDGVLEPGYREGGARIVERGGSTYYDWPRPWAFRCDVCGRTFPYGCVVLERHRRHPPPTVRQTGGDVHVCSYCDGYVEPDVQLTIEGGATA